MSIAPTIPFPLTRPAHGYGDFPPPPWVAGLFNLRHDGGEVLCGGQISLRAAESANATLVSARVHDAASLCAADLQRVVFEAYSLVHDRLRGHHPIRIWNYLPAITDRMSDGRDRYMVFNAGRFEAFCEWYGGAQNFDRQVATASGVGHPGSDLIIHCLAAAEPGTPVANPRQVQPFHYSQRFGPLPPCFARATVVRAPRPLALVGGTASIRGEDSLHALDFPGQMHETLANLAAMVHAAAGRPAPSRSHDLSALKRYTDLRVYLPDAHRSRQVTDAIGDLFPCLRHLEVVHADLCRPELLIEIEGLAELSE